MIPPIQGVIMPPAPVGATEGDGAIRVGTSRDWLRRSRRFPVLEPQVMSEHGTELLVPVSGFTSTPGNSTMDMDVDVLRVRSVLSFFCFHFFCFLYFVHFLHSSMIKLARFHAATRFLKTYEDSNFRYRLAKQRQK